MTTSYSLQELQENVEKLRNLETELDFYTQWQSNPSSPTGVVDHTALMQRYHTAKQCYLHQRLEGFLVAQLETYDEAKPHHFDLLDTDTEDPGLNEKHDQAVASLQTTVEGIQTQVRLLRDTYQTICTKREELEQMIQDMQDSSMQVDDESTEAEEEEGELLVQEVDLDLEQERIEEMQRTKRRLQEKLQAIQAEKEKLAQQGRQNQNDIQFLLQTTQGQDKEDLEDKIQELKEMRFFYDSLREVVEELGGVKIIEVKEDDENHHLNLHLLFYEQFQVLFQLEVHRKNALKLVSAKWITIPVVQSTISNDNGDNGDPSFSLAMSSLDDLVEVAKANLAPPHDVRFVVRESLARIRIQKERVNDLALLRRHVLTKIVGGDQVVCSLNDGIVIVMRLYDNLVRAEQVVGVSGWDAATTDKILEQIQRKEASSAPSSIVQQVQQEIAKLKQAGMNPRTPKIPRRQNPM
eukprot:scaffold8353_cov138-Cylindrotheca_fusiformis.AAC.38